MGKQAGCGLPVPVGFPCFHQKLQHVPALLLEGRGHGQRPTAALTPRRSAMAIRSRLMWAQQIWRRASGNQL
jgi:hypothetical protein